MTTTMTPMHGSRSDARQEMGPARFHPLPQARRGLVGYGIAALLCLVAAAAHPSSAERPRARCVSRGIGLDSECVVNGLALHYVDWGGRGDDLVLLAGLDDSARIYDELAPMLARHHHVLAVTRRGFGHSAIPPSGYDATTLSTDLREFLKAVGVHRADLVGHSMSGLELTRTATSDADLVRRLVYLDAATDKSGLADQWENDPLGNRDPPPDALTSYARLTRWTQQLLKSRSPAIEANVRQCFDSGPGGLVFRTPKSVDAAVVAAIVSDHPDYSAIRAPALAIYSDYDSADQVPPGTSDQARSAADAFSRTVYQPWQEVEKARFRTQMPCGRILELEHTGHYLFLERPRETAAWINSFLASANPCTWSPR
jgi:non-heme chloroperoxidase